MWNLFPIVLPNDVKQCFPLMTGMTSCITRHKKGGGEKQTQVNKTINYN